MVKVKIDKLVFGGQGLGRVEGSGKVVFAWNALPGETVEVKVVKNKKSMIDGIATEILENPSPHRIAPVEDHHLVCSPWQIMDWTTENQWKTDIAQETLKDIGGIDWPELRIEHTEEPQYHYRNKMEYSFTWSGDEADQLSLAFFKRGGRGFEWLPEGCCLAEEGINQTALAVVEWLRANAFFVPKTKSLIVRSNGHGETIAALFIKDHVEFEGWPDFAETVKGFQVYYSDPKSPAALPTELLMSKGEDHLFVELMDTHLKFGLNSFFQVNIPLFRQALADMAQELNPDYPLLDFYSGVGAIGLPLSKHAPAVTLVDNNHEAIAYAQANIMQNQLANCQAIEAEAEAMTDLISADANLILDPPRAGLHADVVKAILDKQPPRVIYLSCNLSTQARDLQKLQAAYEITDLKLYNFFPRTPHIESLAVLKRR